MRAQQYIFVWTLSAIILNACDRNEMPYRAGGVFEAREILVSSEVPGKILHLDLEEGLKLESAQSVGLIDSTQLHLSKKQIEANMNAILASKPDMAKQIAALETELSKAKREEQRIRNLYTQEAATQKQLDDIEAQVAVLEARLSAAKSSLVNSLGQLNAQYASLEAQMQQVQDKIKKCVLMSPMDGVVLVKYAEAGEVTAAGKPLFKLADLDNMILRAYFTAEQLRDVRIGDEMELLAEMGEEELKPFTGRVLWISSTAEFTPKTIRTQDERAHQVYAVKFSVPNDGTLRIGMYGGVK